jgi:DDE superfamily endonuclease
MNRELIDLYSDYLITAFGQTSATNLARVLNHEISHDTITRFLTNKELTSRDFWKIVKPEIRRIQKPNAMIAIDDFIVEKPHNDENGVIAWFFDHTTNQHVQGMNIVDAVYITEDARMPLDLEVVKKLEYKIDADTGKPFREQLRTKHEIYRSFIKGAIQNGVPFSIVLNDVWFASAENMIFLKRELGKDFIMPVKTNRQMKLIGEARYQAVSELALEAGQAVDARIEGVPFTVRLVKAVFTNEDGSVGMLYLVSSLHGWTGEALIAAYQRRWRVEEQHKSVKQNASIGRSPVQLVVGRVNHVFCAFVGVAKLELLRLHSGLNHFALRNKLYLEALKASQEELIRIRGGHSDLVIKSA